MPQGMGSPLGCVALVGEKRSPLGDTIYKAKGKPRSSIVPCSTVNRVVHLASSICPLFVNCGR